MKKKLWLYSVECLYNLRFLGLLRHLQLKQDNLYCFLAIQKHLVTEILSTFNNVSRNLQLCKFIQKCNLAVSNTKPQRLIDMPRHKFGNPIVHA